MSARDDIHLSADQIQAFLEGDIPRDGREWRRVEDHLSICAQCSAEVDAWHVLFADLRELAARPLPRPSAGFTDRVMREIRVPQPLREKKRSWFGRRHPSADMLQDLADGLLPARRAARAHAHVRSCATCAGELESWRGVMATLARVPRFSAGEGFADGVMSALQATPTTSAVVRPVRAPAAPEPWKRALILTRQAAGRTAVRLMPRTRRAWAALSGVAVTPAAIFGLVLWVVFSHPTLTPQALASFAMWQLSDLLAAGWSSLLANGGELASGSAYEAVVQAFTSLVQSPLVLVGGAFLYAATTALALRVLYKNLIAHRRYARVSSR